MTDSIRIFAPFHRETLYYPLLVIHGTSKSSPVYLCNNSNPDASLTQFKTESQSFIATCHLVPGKNNISLSIFDDLFDSTTLDVVFSPPPPAMRKLRLVYLLASDSDGSFQSPDSIFTKQSGINRLRTAGLLIQSACAEMMRAQGFQRRTFRLHPDVFVHRLQITAAQAYAFSDAQLRSHIEQDLRHLPDRQNIIDLAVISFSRFIGGEVRGHTASGGGQLALFGGASIFTWPESVDQIQTVFSNTSTFNPQLYFDDSMGRMLTEGRRAVSASTLGVLLHEVGHCLSLPHPTGTTRPNGAGIMLTGFHNFERLFIRPGFSNSVPCWDRGSALRLRYHRFLRNELEVIAASPLGTIQFERSGAKITCTAVRGIGHIGYYKNGENASYEDFTTNTPTAFILPSLAKLRDRIAASLQDKISFSAIDVTGQIRTESYQNV